MEATFAKLITVFTPSLFLSYLPLIIIHLTSVTQRMAAQPPELKDWERENDVLGAFVTARKVEILFGDVALPSKGQHSFFSPFKS